MSDKKYIVLDLKEARLLVAMIRSKVVDLSAEAVKTINRVEADPGIDLEEISSRLVNLPICFACEQESDEKACESHQAKEVGSLFSDLIDRINK